MINLSKDIMDVCEVLSLDDMREDASTYEMEDKLNDELEYLELADEGMDAQWIRDAFGWRLAGI